MKNKILLFIALLLGYSLPICAACEQHVQFDATKVAVVNTSFSYSQSEKTPIITTIGTIQNSSDSLIEDIVIEVKYFDSEKKLIDVHTQPIYGIVVPPSQEVAFRVQDTAGKPKASYATSRVRVATAEQRINKRPQPKQSSFPWLDILISWGPMLLLIGVWIFFMRRMNKKGSPQTRTVELIEKQNAVLERLASAVEKATLDK